MVWFDGLDWPTTQAAAIAKTGKVYESGKGSGLIFQDYAKGNPQYGYAVTSPTHTQSVRNVDLQTVVVDQEKARPGGYDAEIAGPNPVDGQAALPQGPGLFPREDGRGGQDGPRQDRPGCARCDRLGAECGRVRQRGQVVQHQHQRGARWSVRPDPVQSAPGREGDGRWAS